MRTESSPRDLSLTTPVLLHTRPVASTTTLNKMKAHGLAPLEMSSDPDLDTRSYFRCISPGGSRSDVDMSSPTSSTFSFEAELVPFLRPRSADAIQRTFDNPYANRPLRIHVGQYILFSFNPEYLAEKGSAAEKDLYAQFHGGRYLGLVTGLEIFEEPGETPEDPPKLIEVIMVWYVASSQPPTPAGDLYVPIAPIIDNGKAVARPALRTTGLFPRANRLQWTTFGIRLRVHEFHDAEFGGASLDDDTFAWLAAVGEEDEKALMGRRPAGPNSDAINLRPADEPFPATIWLDLRGEHKEDPKDFITELQE